MFPAGAAAKVVPGDQDHIFILNLLGKAGEKASQGKLPDLFRISFIEVFARIDLVSVYVVTNLPYCTLYQHRHRSFTKGAGLWPIALPPFLLI